MTKDNIRRSAADLDHRNGLTPYQPSGRISPLALVYIPALYFLVLPALALGYAYFIWYLPTLGVGDLFEFVNFFAAMATGYLTGRLAVLLAVKMGKIRHPLFALLIGLFASLAMYYFHWAVWVSLVENNGHLDSVFNHIHSPIALWNEIININATGTWVTYFRSPEPIYTTGTQLAFIWIIEAALIILFSPIKCYLSAGLPFSEEVKRWYLVKVLPEMKLIEDPQEVIDCLKLGREDVLAGIEKLDFSENEGNYAILTLYYLPTQTAYLSIINSVKSKNGRESYVIVKCVEISDVISQALLKIAEK